ncbi:MAG: PhnD/SsuA/transferrin family substrate-binding protein, partial [Deltaproteobacteria bacterium]|nr:PhnD/SsuA/transferrin family substrate-binding protein [Deltaproteobacteria bacterium]
MNRISSTMRICGLLLVSVFIFSAFKTTLTYAVDQPVKIGVLAQRGDENCRQQWSATADYLTQNIKGYNFSIVPLDFDQVVPTTKKAEVDFLLTNPAYYVSLEITYNVDRLLTLINRDVYDKPMTTFAGVIFVLNKRRDITSMKELIGKRFVAVDPESLGGWLAVLRELKEAGIDPEKDFATMSFAGTHDAAVYAVRDGQAD